MIHDDGHVVRDVTVPMNAGGMLIAVVLSRRLSVLGYCMTKEDEKVTVRAVREATLRECPV